MPEAPLQSKTVKPYQTTLWIFVNLLDFLKVRLQCESLKPVIRQGIKVTKERTVLLCAASHDLINIKFDLEHVVSVKDVQRCAKDRRAGDVLCWT